MSLYDIKETDINIHKVRDNNLNIFWGGFILYTLAYTLATTIIYFNIVYLQSLQFVGVLLMVYASISILEFRIKNGYLQTMFILYMLWQIGVVYRGITFDTPYIKELLFDVGYGIFPYLTPLFLLFPLNFAYYRKLFLVILVLSAFHLIYTGAFVKDVFNPDRQSVLSQGMVENFTAMGFSVSFVLLTYLYHEPKKRMFALGMMFFSLLCVVYRARRGWIFMHITTLLSILMVYLIVSKRTAMVVYLAIVMALLGYFYFSSLYNETSFGIFDFLVERGDDDTRTGVEDLFYADMDQIDLLVGRGIKGEYYCPNIESLDYAGRGYRSVIETGFLQIVLKGGWISLVLILCILIPAFILGFTAKNTFCKAFGFIIMLWVIYLYPTVGNSFTLQYILVWVGVGACYSKKIRNMTDEQVSECLNPSLKFVKKPTVSIAK